MEVDRAEAGGGLVDEDARAGYEQVLVDRSEFAGCGELRVAVIDADAHHEVIVVVPYPGAAGELRRAAEAVGGDRVAIDFRQESGGRKRVRDRDVLDK